MIGGNIPHELFDTEEFKTIWLELNYHISMYVGPSSPLVSI